MLIGRVGPSPPPWGTSLVVRSHPKERNRVPVSVTVSPIVLRDKNAYITLPNSTHHSAGRCLSLSLQIAAAI